MSSYDFMKSGIMSSTERNIDVNTIHKIVSLIKLLMEDAIVHAEKFIIACGRNTIQVKDIEMALKYETHEFLLQGETLESRFLTSLEEEQQQTYDTDEEEGSGCDEESEEDLEENEAKNEAENEAENEEYSIILKSEDEELVQLHEKFLKYYNEWDLWTPTDPILIFLKSGVDKTTSKFGGNN